MDHLTLREKEMPEDKRTYGAISSDGECFFAEMIKKTMPLLTGHQRIRILIGISLTK